MQQQTPKPRKKGRWILLAVLAALTASVVALGLWQKNNLYAVTQFNQYTQEELEEQLEMNDQHVQDVLEQALQNAQQVDNSGDKMDVPTGDLSAMPEKEPVTTPPATENPAAEQKPTSGKEKAPDAQKPEQQPEQKPVAPAVKPTPTPTEPTGPTYEEQLKAIVDKVYALRVEYMKALDDLQAEAVAAYKAIPKEKRNAKELASFVSKFTSKGTALERECDGKMDTLIKELKALQKKYGQDMELIDAVKYTYAQEKSLKKAWYMSELERRGLI